MRTGLSDTHPDIERIMIDGYRRMSPIEKLQRVASLNRTLDLLVQARIEADHGSDIDPTEAQLRAASLRLSPEIMVEVFGWDPRKEGY